MEPYDLTVIVPTHDSEETIGPLAEVLLGIDGPSLELLVVDDASTDGTVELVRDLAARDDRVTLLAHETNRGAGIARNTAFPHAQGRYTLFFDDDDVIHTDALVRTLADLDRGGQDLAILRYHYRRMADDGRMEMNVHDLDVWDEVVGAERSTTVRLDEADSLAGLTNYPWNKVLRTQTYRSAGLRFGSTPVHNDILGHWYSLLFADRILLVNAELCTHVVMAGGSNLTNRDSLERLTLFDAFDEAYDLLAAHPTLRRRYAAQYWASVVRIASWAADRTAPTVRTRFDERLQEHLMRIDLADFASLRRSTPEVSRAIVRKALG